MKRGPLRVTGRHAEGLSGVRTVFAVLWGGEPKDTHAVAAAIPPNTAVLRHEGAYWTLDYAGSTGRLKDTRGLRYLSQLLREPGREFHVIDLAQSTAGASRGGDDGGPPVAVANSGLALLDATAKADYRRLPERVARRSRGSRAIQRRRPWPPRPRGDRGDQRAQLAGVVGSAATTVPPAARPSVRARPSRARIGRPSSRSARSTAARRPR